MIISMIKLNDYIIVMQVIQISINKKAIKFSGAGEMVGL